MKDTDWKSDEGRFTALDIIEKLPELRMRNP